MGATGSDSFYLQLLNDVMRLCRARANLTLDGIRAGIEDSSMTPTQRSLAMTRLEFAARFIDDGASLRSVLQPGRVVIVDVRDEFIEKEQALGLFVTMLNVFAGAGMGEESFNKLIVFDEAHKYMAGGPLIKSGRRSHSGDAPQGCLGHCGVTGSDQRTGTCSGAFLGDRSTQVQLAQLAEAHTAICCSAR
jgi:hypothetical protein